MKLRKIEFEGIRAFSEKTTFYFGRDPGLYFLQGGDNQQDPELGSNGVGKSTIWSVLCWVLFGKTSDGLRAGDLKSWQSEEKGYRAKLWLGRSVVERSWKPNKLTFDGEVVSEIQLQDILGITFDTFTTTVLISQGAPMFFDLSAVRKLSMFTGLLQLDEWISFSDEAKALASKIEAEIHTKNVAIARVEGKLDGLDISVLKEKKENFRSERYLRMTKMQTELREMKADLEKLRKRRDKAKKFKKELSAQQVEELASLNGLKDRQSKAKILFSAAKVLLRTHESAKQSLREGVAHLKTHKGKNCVFCGQKISNAVAKNQIEDLEETEAEVNAEIETTSKEVKKLDRRINVLLEGSLRAANSDYRNRSKHLYRVEGDIESLEKEYSDFKIATGIVDAKVQRIYKDKNPFAPLLKEKMEQEAELIATLKRRNRIRDRLTAEQDLTKYWIKGFKDVRLYLIEESLKQLEVETNRALAELGFSTDWSIKYMVERATLSGRSTVGFEVLVKSPYSDGHVPFAAWSGGEKQRLRIAGSMGFMSLVSARTGMDLGLEVYDEPTQHLSPQGIDSLLEALRLRAQETGKRIWLVDHHTLDYGEFISTAIVSKDVRGCSTVAVGL